MHVLKRSARSALSPSWTRAEDARSAPRAYVLSAVCGLTVLVACSHKAETFTTHVEISRTQVVTTGAARAVDVELEYSDCPGEQREIFQADAAFADCLAQYKVGEKVEAQIVWQQMPDGHFDSEVDKVGSCPRKRDAQDERSYEIVHECHDIIVNGMNIGFRCDRKPTPELLSKCPWFRRT